MVIEQPDLPDNPSWEDIQGILIYLIEDLKVPQRIVAFLHRYLKAGFNNAQQLSLSAVETSPEDQTAHRVLFHKTPYLRRQPLTEVTYTCQECGNDCTAWLIPSPFKPSYCVNADGTESACQHAARLRRQREYNKRRKQKKIQEA